MAEVWLGRATGVKGFQKTIVLKTILPHLADDPDFLRMFVDEALLAAALNHPNIVQIFDLGQIGETYFIAMEFILGKTMRQVQRVLRKQRKVMPPWLVLRVIVSICDALHYAHERRSDDGQLLGIVHRDVTPENIMISFSGVTKVVDFGIAKASTAANVTRAGKIKGKLSYLAPEQIVHAGKRPADFRSDIYSLGVMLYEMLTGVRPFRAPNDMALLMMIPSEEPAPPSEIARWVPARLSEIVLRAMAKDPEKRYQDAAELGEDLEAFLTSVGTYPTERHISGYLAKLFSEEERRGPGLDPHGTGKHPPRVAHPPEPGPGDDLEGPDSAGALSIEISLDTFITPSTEIPARLSEAAPEEGKPVPQLPPPFRLPPPASPPAGFVERQDAPGSLPRLPPPLPRKKGRSTEPDGFLSVSPPSPDAPPEISLVGSVGDPRPAPDVVPSPEISLVVPAGNPSPPAPDLASDFNLALLPGVEVPAIEATPISEIIALPVPPSLLSGIPAPEPLVPAVGSDRTKTSPGEPTEVAGPVPWPPSVTEIPTPEPTAPVAEVVGPTTVPDEPATSSAFDRMPRSRPSSFWDRLMGKSLDADETPEAEEAPAEAAVIDQAETSTGSEPEAGSAPQHLWDKLVEPRRPAEKASSPPAGTEPESDDQGEPPAEASAEPDLHLTGWDAYLDRKQKVIPPARAELPFAATLSGEPEFLRPERTGVGSWKRQTEAEVEAAELFDEGLVLFRQGQGQAALTAWERAVELAPENRIYQGNLRRLRKTLEEGSS